MFGFSVKETKLLIAHFIYNSYVQSGAVNN